MRQHTSQHTSQQPGSNQLSLVVMWRAATVHGLAASWVVEDTHHVPANTQARQHEERHKELILRRFLPPSLRAQGSSTTQPERLMFRTCHGAKRSGHVHASGQQRACGGRDPERHGWCEAEHKT